MCVCVCVLKYGCEGVLEQVALAMSTEVRPQDNRGFSDTNTAQRLTEGDIRKMKSDGKGGQAIIQARGRLFAFCNDGDDNECASFWDYQRPPSCF